MSSERQASWCFRGRDSSSGWRAAPRCGTGYAPPRNETPRRCAKGASPVSPHAAAADLRRSRMAARLYGCAGAMGQRDGMDEGPRAAGGLARMSGVGEEGARVGEHQASRECRAMVARQGLGRAGDLLPAGSEVVGRRRHVGWRTANRGPARPMFPVQAPVAMRRDEAAPLCPEIRYPLGFSRSRDWRGVALILSGIVILADPRLSL